MAKDQHSILKTEWCGLNRIDASGDCRSFDPIKPCIGWDCMAYCREMPKYIKQTSEKRRKRMGNYSFEDVCKEISIIDQGGEAGRQVDITEIRQSVSNFLKFAAKHMTIENVAGLIAQYVDKKQDETT